MFSEVKLGMNKMAKFVKGKDRNEVGAERVQELRPEGLKNPQIGPIGTQEKRVLGIVCSRNCKNPSGQKAAMASLFCNLFKM